MGISLTNCQALCTSDITCVSFEFKESNTKCQRSTSCTYSVLDASSNDEWDVYIKWSSNTALIEYGPIQDWDVSLVTDMSRLFEEKNTFNADISKWIVGKVTTMQYSTYTLPPLPLQDRVFFGSASISPSSFCGSTNSIFEQCSLLFFFQNYFYPWIFLCCCGAVFEGAGAFNGDLSAWPVGNVTEMGSSTYTLFPPSLSKIGSLFWVVTCCCQH